MSAELYIDDEPETQDRRYYVDCSNGDCMWEGIEIIGTPLPAMRNTNYRSAAGAIMNACLLVGGPVRRVKVKGEWIRFEMHPICGPMPVYKNGSQHQLVDSHDFWRVVSLWVQQGKRLDGETAVWNEHVEPRYPVTLRLVTDEAK